MTVFTLSKVIIPCPNAETVYKSPIAKCKLGGYTCLLEVGKNCGTYDEYCREKKGE